MEREPPAGPTAPGAEQQSIAFEVAAEVGERGPRHLIGNSPPRMEAAHVGERRQVDVGEEIAAERCGIHGGRGQLEWLEAAHVRDKRRVRAHEGSPGRGVRVGRWPRGDDLVVVPTRTICEVDAGDADACAFAPPCPRSTAATVIDPSFTARIRSVTGCWPATVPLPPPNTPRAPDPPRAPVAPVAPVVVVGLCDLSKVMPAANPPPARTSAAAIPITICGAFISNPFVRYYSYLSAWIGWSRAARIAGYKPKTTPPATETPTAMITVPLVMRSGRLAACGI